ncbi:MAG: methyltransferase domain-containing protein [Sideroxyarcus sp.]|nr:methyltransferase domain-containing protein [Sideroxyarcus sp.]
MESGSHPGVHGSATALHEMRIAAVVGALLDAQATSVLDLGCGEGELMVRLAAQAQFRRIVGIDISDSVLQMARCLLGLDPFASPGRVEVLHASFTEPDSALKGFDAAVLLETIEHIDPGRLSRVERAVFGSYRPRTVFITTPNHEYNFMYGMAPGQFRHPDHCFEWDRSKFRHWACGVAERNGYSVIFQDIGDPHPTLGASTQMAIFTLIADSNR